MTDAPRRHDWTSITERRIPACETADGNDRTEKTCGACGLIKITVHPAQGFPWREWRHRNGKTFIGDQTPPCLPQPVEEVAFQ